MGGSYDDGGGDADGGPPEMQKAADAADISVLFFQLVLIFGPFWVIFGPFFGANFLWQNMHLCYLNRFLQL